MTKRIKPQEDKRGCLYIGPKGTSFGRDVYLVNPENRDYVSSRFILWFGAYGTTRLMVWENHLEDAIETAAEWLAKYAPGHIMPMWGDDHKELVKEACEDEGISFPEGFEALEDEKKWAICESAEADLTMTESGFLTSYEWGIDMENPTRAELDEFLYPSDLDWSAERGA